MLRSFSKTVGAGMIGLADMKYTFHGSLGFVRCLIHRADPFFGSLSSYFWVRKTQRVLWTHLFGQIFEPCALLRPRACSGIIGLNRPTSEIRNHQPECCLK
jgi:hypothetical protein